MIDINITLLSIYSFIIGICVGSFLNVVILRAFSGESIVLPPSKCPKCNHKLMWYHNIPLFSYIFLRGKCAFCKEKISIQYPIIEFLTGVLFLVSFLILGLSFNTLYAWIFIAFLIVMSVTDIKEMVVFDRHIYSFIVVMYIISLLSFSLDAWWTGLLGILVAFIVFEFLAKFGYLFTDSRMFGEGDTYIAMGVGAYLGPIGVFYMIALSILLQAVLSIPYVLYKFIKEKNKDKIIGFSLLFFAGISAFIIRAIAPNLNSYLTTSFLLIMFALAITSIVFIFKNTENSLYDWSNKNENKNKDKIIALAIEFFAIIFALISQAIMPNLKSYLMYGLLFILLILEIILKNKENKENEENEENEEGEEGEDEDDKLDEYIKLPFGPAIAVAGIILFFYMQMFGF